MLYLLPWYYTTIFFCHRLSDGLHCKSRPFTYVLRKDIPPLYRRSKCTPFRQNVLNEISRKSNLNRTTWLKFCDGSFTIVTPINCFVIELISYRFINYCNDSLFAGMTLVLKSQVHCSGVIQWWDCSSLASTALLVEQGCGAGTQISGSCSSIYKLLDPAPEPFGPK